jgi:glycosyltransferase involved in cell wall biosynthesis
VEARIAAHGLQDRVALRGWLGADEVHAELAASDVFLMPSLSEGLSVAAVEALKEGLAILGSDIGGLTDLVEPGANGFLVPCNDTDAYAEKLRLFLTDPVLLERCRTASREKVREFDLKNIAEQYEGVCREATGAR